MKKKRIRLFLGTWLVLAGAGSQAQDSLARTTPQPLPLSVEKYNLLYHTRPKKSNTAAVSEIYGPELQKTVSPSFGGWLTGRIPGIYTLQSTGLPGGDDVAVFLRGQAPLVLIDGTPQSFPSINPEQIESITLLKDAVSTAMLGMRGGNGALLITTKKGTRQKQKMEFLVQHGIQRPTQLPRFLDAFNWASLYNEALSNEGLAPAYSAADLEAYRNGSDPVGHPNVDWQKEILREQAPYSRYDFSIYGGNRSTRYLVNLDYLHQQGIFREQDFNTYSTNADYRRYIVRSNLEVDLTPALTTSLNLIGRIQNTNQAGITPSAIFNNFRNVPANAHPVLNTNGSVAGRPEYQANPYGQAFLSGYTPMYERDFKVDFALRGNLDKWAKGLWVKALAAINAYQRETINRSKTFAVFRENQDLSGNKTYTQFGVTSNQSNSATANSQNRLFYTELSAGYTKMLDENNRLEAQLLASNDHRRINSDLPQTFSGLGFRLSYDRDRKYFLDLAAGYNGTDRLPKQNRYGFFPALGLGWDLSQERFLAAAAPWINYLKLRVSAGLTGNANVGYYDYYQYYTTGSGYGFGSTVPSVTTTLLQGPLANPNLSFERGRKLSAGLEASLLRNRLSFTADFFSDHYYDLVQSRLDGSDILGTGYISENIGKTRYGGWEFSISWQEKRGALSYFVSPNLSLLQSEALYLGEPSYPFSYLAMRGSPVGAAYGYVADGLFQSTAEIAAHAFQGSTIRPGDIRYKDLNGDGFITPLDQQVIGNRSPLIVYGLNAGLRFRQFDLSVLAQGLGNYTRETTGLRAFGNNGRAQAYQYQLDRWTPSNPDASYPRMYIGNHSNNNLYSSYWIQKADYLRIRNLELGYSFPEKLIGRARLSMARLFVNATNLFTFTSLKDMDPETAVGAYPNMKVLTGGINIQF